jgi:hypothetical protein
MDRTVYLLGISLESVCTEPLDKILGLIGLVAIREISEFGPIWERQPLYKAKPIEVNYSKTLWEIYHEVLSYYTRFHCYDRAPVCLSNPWEIVRFSQLVRRTLGMEFGVRDSESFKAAVRGIRVEGSLEKYDLGPTLNAMGNAGRKISKLGPCTPEIYRR